jgi:hypothetical protein
MAPYIVPVLAGGKTASISARQELMRLRPASSTVAPTLHASENTNNYRNFVYYGVYTEVLYGVFGVKHV